MIECPRCGNKDVHYTLGPGMCMRGQGTCIVFGRICAVCSKPFTPKIVQDGHHITGEKKTSYSRRVTCSTKCQFHMRDTKK